MKILNKVSLRNYSWLGVGGNSDIIHVETLEDLKELPAIINDKKCQIIGQTSKIIFPDQDNDGLLLRYIGKKMILEGNLLIAESGVALSFLSRFIANNGFQGFSGLVGIPGDLGGAVCNNAGAFNDEISRYIDEIYVYSISTHEFIKISSAQGKFSYRYSVFKEKKDWLIYQVTFRLVKGDTKKEMELMQEVTKRRLLTQPKGLKTLGSIFKNPINNSAGKLLEECLGKGFAGINIALSIEHANFFIINKEASAENILSFIDILYTKVYNEKAIALEKEVIVFRW